MVMRLAQYGGRSGGVSPTGETSPKGRETMRHFRINCRPVSKCPTGTDATVSMVGIEVNSEEFARCYDRADNHVPCGMDELLILALRIEFEVLGVHLGIRQIVEHRSDGQYAISVVNAVD